MPVQIEHRDCIECFRGRFITNVKSKARFHASDFVMNRGSIAVAM